MGKNPSGKFRGRFSTNISFITVPSSTFSCFQNILTRSEMNAALVGHFDSNMEPRVLKPRLAQASVFSGQY